MTERVPGNEADSPPTRLDAAIDRAVETIQILDRRFVSEITTLTMRALLDARLLRVKSNTSPKLYPVEGDVLGRFPNTGFILTSQRAGDPNLGPGEFTLDDVITVYVGELSEAGLLREDACQQLIEVTE